MKSGTMITCKETRKVEKIVTNIVSRPGKLGPVHVVVVRDILKLNLHVMGCVPGGDAVNTHLLWRLEMPFGA